MNGHHLQLGVIDFEAGLEDHQPDSTDMVPF
jgi:hypothetical protein